MKEFQVNDKIKSFGGLEAKVIKLDLNYNLVALQWIRKGAIQEVLPRIEWYLITDIVKNFERK